VAAPDGGFALGAVRRPHPLQGRMLEVQSAGNEVMVIDLTTGGVSYDKLVADVFSHDKVFCW